jgi:hypothetical protein
MSGLPRVEMRCVGTYKRVAGDEAHQGGAGCAGTSRNDGREFIGRGRG